MTKKSTYHLVFTRRGRNEFGAATGTLTLYHNNVISMVTSAFSGGLNSPAQSEPIPPATYHLNLNVRGYARSDKQLVALPGRPDQFVLHHWYGIERIDMPEAQVEWGRFRVALNPPHKNMSRAYRGNFIHGKTRPDDYTHGCICERSEMILQTLWQLPPQTISLSVEA